MLDISSIHERAFHALDILASLGHNDDPDG
jgi:hypothetical protein